MSDYAPTTEQVRDGYRYDPEAEYHDPITPHHEINGRAFDRWLKAHDAQVAAQALREAADEAERHADEGCPSCSNNPVSACSGANKLTAAWLRSRAEQTKEDR